MLANPLVEDGFGDRRAFFVWQAVQHYILGVGICHADYKTLLVVRHSQGTKQVNMHSLIRLCALR